MSRFDGLGGSNLVYILDGGRGRGVGELRVRGNP